jgi:hypothetical protein
MGSDLRKRFSTDKSTNDKTLTYRTDFGKDFGIFYSTLAYTRTLVTSKVSASQQRNSDNYSINLDGSFKLKNVRYSWNLGEDLERTAYIEAKKSDFLTATTLGLKASFPSTLVMQTKVTFADNDYYQNETDNNTSQYFFSISRNLMRNLLKDNLLFDFTYEQKGYRYFGGDNNYAETIMKGTLSYKF